MEYEGNKNLEERTFQFAKAVSFCVRKLGRTISNVEYFRQVIRSSASIGANYIEANEALSKKDFLMRIRICRKEAKETCYWLRLLSETNETSRGDLDALTKEATELKKILSAIILKCKPSE
jgi:four helix bundle protein